MGFRFRKSIRLLPGVRLNLTKNGINSLSLGGRGASYNIGKKGTRTTVGLPGTGLSDSEYQPYAKNDNGQVEPPSLFRRPRTWMLILIGLVIIAKIMGIY